MYDTASLGTSELSIYEASSVMELEAASSSTVHCLLVGSSTKSCFPTRFSESYGLLEPTDSRTSCCNNSTVLDGLTSLTCFLALLV